jgi:RNA polymerase sigma-70 factor, ECF subfamily
MAARRDEPSSGDSAERVGKAKPMYDIGFPAGASSDADFPSDQVSEPGAQWQQVVEQIRCGDDAGMKELYRVFENGIRFYFWRQLGIQELDDKVHDTFLIVVQAIRRGHLREPERLMGFVRTVVRRQVAAGIDLIMQSRRDEEELEVNGPIADQRRNPEQRIAFEEKVDFMRGILKELCPKDRNILTRYYLHEETEDQICQEMNLTGNQFRLLKSRAKARFGGLGQLRLRQSRSAEYFKRNLPSSPH